ncbi:hypothetical protein CLUG_02709 [Clavispora lusitaniae ATCC 42720]|uniref:Uncharacterized protein n=1 Tax=Clavispora lusitaniae (strain ATCC 42720) TaxID=306902 RepID=C4Y2E6_CLAL4|nr:uncharacterized protein CLUG_02709 [Clavispora lusitaniae ATCC 42720]EEQ38583.1 hypothetical protein CLUG_02709 [Clavispora lusitaniae ATCC 42720]
MPACPFILQVCQSNIHKHLNSNRSRVSLSCFRQTAFVSVDGLPLWLIFEKTQCRDILQTARKRKAVVDPGRQNQQVVLGQLGPDPTVAPIPHIKVAFAVNNVPNLFVFVIVFFVESAHLSIVRLFVATKRFQVELDSVPVLVVSFLGQGF